MKNDPEPEEKKKKKVSQAMFYNHYLLNGV